MSAAAQAARMSVPGTVRNLARQGGESLAIALRIVSDLTAQEVALLIGMVRERVSLRPAASTAETAGDFVTGLTDAGKILLDLAGGESVVITDGMKEILGLRPSFAALADLVPRGINTVIDMHKHLLDMVAEQTRDLVESYADGRPLMPVERMAAMTRETIQSFIETQKMFLDNVAEQVTIATEGGKEGKAGRRDRSKALTQLAREGVDKFIEAQKELLELAIERIQAEGRGQKKPVPRTSLAEMARESVVRFTTAQKSLLDLALKPMAGGEEDEEPKPRARKRPAKTRQPEPKRTARKRPETRSARAAAAAAGASETDTTTT